MYHLWNKELGMPIAVAAVEVVHLHLLLCSECVIVVALCGVGRVWYPVGHVVHHLAADTIIVQSDRHLRTALSVPSAAHANGCKRGCASRLHAKPG